MGPAAPRGQTPPTLLPKPGLAAAALGRTTNFAGLGGGTYTARNYANNGRNYQQRTYTRNNTTIVHNYNTYYRGGYAYHSYVPFYSYEPSFYSWCYHPWYTPTYYGWGWTSDPWYPHYGYYFHPYPAYYSPIQWITDYFFSSLLQNNYRNEVGAARADAAAARQDANDARTQLLTQQMKDQVGVQVQAAMAAHEKKESLTVQDVMKDPKYLVAITAEIEVTYTNQDGACTLSRGDIVRFASEPLENERIAHMFVVTAKKGSCHAGSRVEISMEHLQEMQNDFMEKVEEGMNAAKKELADKKH